MLTFLPPDQFVLGEIAKRKDKQMILDYKNEPEQ